MMTDQTIWQGRLRSRRSVVGTSRERPVGESTGKPKGIVKHYGTKLSKKRLAAMRKSYATGFSQQKADTLRLAGES